eukprot:CAMPEP_0113958760 /NCGR_PEP_ID=MMETSP0011_2-20120614/3682_1 /TAXON_ID=101924 /ORGANISM="Rhodosorus marinus" /LENGTH=1039 /DNA_ID=CAMNT_0000969825 /DNA_START=39 /DNA_END=3158 /DNA_ORIENTATION=- /assembly_acc=CAM_ASM_000156
MEGVGILRSFAVPVEDAIAVSGWGLTAESKGKKCLLAASGTAFLFNLENGHVEDSFPLPRAEKVLVAIGNEYAAVCTSEGLLRVRSNRGRQMDLRIQDCESVERVCTLGSDTLVVFESGGGCGTVQISSMGLKWERIASSSGSEGTAGRIYSSIFTSAPKSSSLGPIIYASEASEDMAFFVRASGDVQLWKVRELSWKARKLVWEWNVAMAAWEIIAGNDRSTDIYYEVVSCKAVGNGRMCSLVAYSTAGSPARLYIVTNRVTSSSPAVEHAVELQTWGKDDDVHGALESVELVVSSGVAYVVFGGEGVAAFVSISEGVQEADQICGEVSFVLPDGEEIACVLDAYGDDLQGGAVAILFRERYTIACAGVPAPSIASLPKSTRSSRKSRKGVENVDSSLASASDSTTGRKTTQKSLSTKSESHLNAVDTVWRAFLQYANNQTGATRVTLEPLAADFEARGGAASADASSAIAGTSNRIVNGGSRDEDLAPYSLLVNHTLSEKQTKHAKLLNMLGDERVMKMRLWDILDQSSRSIVVGNAGRLSAAVMIRTLENSKSNEDIMNSTSMIITESIQRAKDKTDVYQEVSRFERFLPSLQEVFEEVASASFEGLPDDTIDMTSVGEAALMALGGCFSAMGAGLRARNEILDQAQVNVEDRGGWPCTERIIAVAQFLVDRSLKISDGTAVLLRGALHSSSAILIDVMLEAIQVREGSNSNVFESQRSRWLNRIRLYEPEKALELAEKFKDFSLMMELTCDRGDFDRYLQRWAPSYGDAFVRFALTWMEQNGKAKILIEPRTGALGQLQAQFFAEGNRSNLRWLYLLAVEDYARSAEAAFDHGVKIRMKAAENSVQQSKTLLSFAKLANLVDETDRSPREMEVALERSLYLIRAQEDVAPEESSVLPVADLIRLYVDTKHRSSQDLCIAVVIALEISKKSELDPQQSTELHDYVWSRCMSNQGDIWKPIVEEAKRGGVSDERLSRLIRETAFFSAAVNVALGQQEAAAMMSRGVFSNLGLGEEDTVHRLIRTSVDLAGEATAVDA